MDELASTRDKLGEAGFFLGKLQEECSSPMPREPIHFRYYLSAFLNAGYCVRQHARTEAVCILRPIRKEMKLSGRTAYEHWEMKWESDLQTSEKNVWDFMNNNRGQEVHKGRVETVQKEKAVPHERGNYSRLLSGIIDETTVRMNQELGLPLWTTAWFTAYDHYFPDATGFPDILKTGRKYQSLLQRFVEALEQMLDGTLKAAAGSEKNEGQVLQSRTG